MSEESTAFHWAAATFAFPGAEMAALKGRKEPYWALGSPAETDSQETRHS